MVLSLKAWKSRTPPGLPRTDFLFILFMKFKAKPCGFSAGLFCFQMRAMQSISTSNGPCQGDTQSNFTIDGAIGGGTLGYNKQSSDIVLGLEADFSWSSVGGKTSCANTSVHLRELVGQS
jgi:hypothetical protein